MIINLVDRRKIMQTIISCVLFPFVIYDWTLRACLYNKNALIISRNHQSKSSNSNLIFTYLEYSRNISLIFFDPPQYNKHHCFRILAGISETEDATFSVPPVRDSIEVMTVVTVAVKLVGLDLWIKIFFLDDSPFNSASDKTSSPV